MSAIDDRPFPRGALIGAGLLVALSIVGAAGARWQATHAPALDPVAAQQVAMQPVMARDLRFSDQADGSVLIEDMRPGVAPIVIAAGGNGFIRGVMRGMARDRKRRGFGPEAPFRLALWPNGRLTLEDTVTARRVDLDGFGITNRQAFANLLAPPPPATGAPPKA